MTLAPVNMCVRGGGGDPAYLGLIKSQIYDENK